MTIPAQDLAARITANAEDAWAPEVIEAAARLPALSVDFQRILDAAKRAAVRVRDWRAAVTARRAELDDERRATARAQVGETEKVSQVRAQLLYASNGEARKTVANIITIVVNDPRWEGRLAYHAMRDEVLITTPIDWHADDAPAKPEAGPWTDADTTRATSWIAREWSLDVPSSMVAEAIGTAARKVIIDPLRDYLDALRWDAIPRLDTWLSVYLGAPLNDYTRAIGTRWLISAVARALRPGCKVDCVLVLEGKQGIGKSSALRALCPFDDLFFDDDLPIGDKDAAQNLAGKWIVELGELTTLTRHELAQTKAFITRAVDHYRPSYGRTARDFPRHCVFAGSTNDVEYLRDEENRRFWPVKCDMIDVASVARDRDLLWAEAVARFQSNEPWYVDTAELAAICRDEQEQRAQADPWEEHIATWVQEKLERPCEGRILGPRCPCPRCAGVTVSGVLAGAVGLEKARQDKREEGRAAAILRRLGWGRGPQCRQAGTRVRPYFPPAPPSQGVPSG